MTAELMRAGLQALIEAEVAVKIGAGRNERNEGRTTHRNGYRTKTVFTPVRDIGARIPKLRYGSSFPALLERRRRIDRAQYAVIMQAYVHGCPPVPWMTSSAHSGSTPQSPRPRSPGSAPISTPRSKRFAPGP